jgi:hypothetical protein
MPNYVIANNIRYEIEPCPFCKGEAKLNSGTYHSIMCKNCGCECDGFETALEAIEHWNTRL